MLHRVKKRRRELNVTTELEVCVDEMRLESGEVWNERQANDLHVTEALHGATSHWARFDLSQSALIGQWWWLAHCLL